MNGPLLDPRMEGALVVNTVAFTVLFVYLLGERLRLAKTEALQDEVLQQVLTTEVQQDEVRQEVLTHG
jgi:hypothetical protein